MMREAVPVEVEKRKAGTSQGNGDLTGRSREERKNGDKIGEQHKEGDGADERNVAEAVVPDIFFEQVLDAKAHVVGEQKFGDLLRGAGALDRQAGPQEKREKRAHDEHDQCHDYVLGNWQFGVFWLDMQGMKQDESQAPQIVIRKMRDYADVFFHRVSVPGGAGSPLGLPRRPASRLYTKLKDAGLRTHLRKSLRLPTHTTPRPCSIGGLSEVQK